MAVHILRDRKDFRAVSKKRTVFFFLFYFSWSLLNTAFAVKLARSLEALCLMDPCELAMGGDVCLYGWKASPRIYV
jgi:hypothetical protein